VFGFGLVGIVSGRLAEGFCFSVEEGWGVTFAHAVHGQDLEGDSYDEEDVEDPTPCQVLSDIFPEYRPDRRPEER
jgi:hypothetical protein